MMKWLTLEQIKQQLRIEPDFTDEDALLEKYGESAENTVLKYLNRSYQEVIETYGGIPADVVHATLMLVDESYMHRSPASPQQMYYVLYGFDIKIKPYMRLGSRNECAQVFTLGSDVKILIDAELPEGLKMEEVNFTVTVYNADEKDVKKVYPKSECLITDAGNYIVLVNSEELGIGTYMVKAVFEIPDIDYPTGYRREAIRINPHVKVYG